MSASYDRLATVVLKTTETQQQAINRRLNKILCDGKLIQLHVSRWHMQDNLKAEDLGLTEEEIPGLFALGRKLLLDPSIDNDIINGFARIEGQARRYLKWNSFPFPISHAHFVPLRKVLKVLDKLDEFKQKFNENLDQFLENYERYQQMMTEAHPNIVAEMFPAADVLRRKFGFSVSTYQITLPKKMSPQELAGITAELKLQEQAQHQLLSKYEQQMETIHNEAVERIREFVPEAAKALRSKVLSLFSEMTEKIEKGQTISTKNVSSMRAMIETFEQMDFYSDTAVKAELDKVRALLETTTTFKDNQTAITELQTNLQQLVNVTSNMNDLDTLTGNYFRNLG